MFEYPYINQTYMDILWCVPLTRLLTIVGIAYGQELQYVFGYPYINQTYMDIKQTAINHFRYSIYTVCVWISLHQPDIHGHLWCVPLTRLLRPYKKKILVLRHRRALKIPPR